MTHPLRTNGAIRPAGKASAVEIVHAAIPGRTRFRVRAIIDDPAATDALVAALARQPGVATLRANPLTGSVLVTFAPPATSASLAATIRAHLRNRIAPRLQPRSLSAAAVPAGAAAAASAWHAARPGETLRRLNADRRAGLTTREAEARLARSGPNELPRAEPPSIVAMFAEQCRTLPVALLAASAGISVLTGGVADAAVILGVVLLNAGIATATERQSERTILGLTQYPLNPVTTLRDGAWRPVAPATLVPGDVFLVEPGTLVPADARLVEAGDLTVNESALTGESLPVHKESEVLLSPDAVVAERGNMLFRGTAVTGGRGIAVAVATGAATEVGRVQSLLGTVRPPETPLQRQLGDVGRELVLVNGAICAAVFGIGLLRGQGMLHMLKSAISLAVAAVPEGLPAVATTTLALGIQQMRQRDVLVRRLDAVETLGAVQVLGLDKTGTLTANRMVAVAVHVGGALHDLADGSLMADGRPASPQARAAARRAFEIASLCSEAALSEGPGGPAIDGSPTEMALVQAALDLGVDVSALRRRHPVLKLVPRAERRKRMATLHAGRLLAVKGDPIEVLARCDRVRAGGSDRTLDAEAREAIVQANDRMAGRALRVLGIAERSGGGDPAREEGLTWLGLVGMADPLRPGTLPAMRRLHRAGVRTVMLTGDQSATAFAIARDLDLGDGGEVRVLDAGRLPELAPDVLAALAPQVDVFARVSPANKLQIVQALQRGGRIVGMTGDGINDGPALRAADIGIAMGGAGTNVAREAADVILATDRLDGVLEAIELGRATYGNIRKVLRYLVSTNASETLVMLGAGIAGIVEPLTPMQLLWLNLASDVLPAIALGLEPPEPDVLGEPPHDPRAPILALSDFRRLLREGAVIGAGALGVFVALGAGPRAGTVAFHGLTVAQLLHAIACRSEMHGIGAELTRPPNRLLYGALAACAALQVAAQTLPATRRLLGLGPLTAGDIGTIALAGLAPLAANEAISALLRDGRSLHDEAAT